MVAIGDIVSAMAPMAGYRKWHLCVLEATEGIAACFLFLNSNEGTSGFEGDYICPDAEFPFLPQSPTGQTVISCSAVIRINVKQLALYEATTVGVIPLHVAIGLRTFVADVKSLTSADKKIVLAALDSIVAAGGTAG